MESLRLRDTCFRCLWKEIFHNDDFDATALAVQAAHDGGYDFEGTSLSTSDIEHVLGEGCIADLSDMAFFVSEVLAYYLAVGKLMKPLQLISFSLCASLAKSLSQRGHLDWDFEAEHILGVLCEIRKGTTREVMRAVLDCVFEAP